MHFYLSCCFSPIYICCCFSSFPIYIYFSSFFYDFHTHILCNFRPFQLNNFDSFCFLQSTDSNRLIVESERNSNRHRFWSSQWLVVTRQLVPYIKFNIQCILYICIKAVTVNSSKIRCLEFYLKKHTTNFVFRRRKFIRILLEFY